MELGILGPLTAWQDGRELPLGSPRQRAVLAVLLLRRDELVPTATLVDELWGESPPPTAVKAVQVWVSRLRKALGHALIETQPLGYALRLEGSELDAQTFEALLEQGRRLLGDGAAAEAAEVLRRALALWRGPPLADFRYEAFARNEIARLEELRLAALEQRLEADLALGRHADAVPELAALAREHPLRESPRRLLMLALYRAGRQADALAAYQDARTELLEGLGLDPPQSLQRLESAILRQDPSLELVASPPPVAAPQPAPPARPVAARKTVTVLRCAVPDGPAEPDPELRRAAISRLLRPAAAALERHGGTVETPAGDSMTAVFGVPTVREDDALRALRAASELRELLPGCRIGVATGEVVTGAGEPLGTGAVTDLAAELAGDAAAGEVVLDAATLALARGAVDVETQGAGAYRLVAARADAVRLQRAPMVGRGRQLHQLGVAFAGLESGRCQLFTILGEAGVGKSRLVSEFLAGLEAAVVRGRCLSYGEGITYWPVVEVLKQLGTRPTEGAAAEAVASLLGETDASAAADVIAWAVRKTLEEAAAGRPLVVVFDDVHRGEQAFLDLVEHVADFSRDSPLLLLCMARPELFERRPGWAGGKLNATTVLLEPLSPAEADELIARLAPVDETLRDRIRAAAGGNPLFLEEMVTMAHESGSGEVVVPPTIRALLAARLDRLEPAERAVLQCGAVEGEVFHRGAVGALAAEEGDVAELLPALVRKELIRPERAQLAGDEAFRFRHLLIRDAAYDALPKAARAGLHEHFARWLDERGDELVELDELVGYHLEQAARYRRELGLPDGDTLAAAARGRLEAAGQRALLRQDPAAAANLLGRAAALLPDGATDVPLELELTETLVYAGDLEGAVRHARSLAERSAAAGDRVGELCGRIGERVYRTHFEPEGGIDRLATLLADAMPVFEEAQDDLALWFGWLMLASVEKDRLQMGAMEAASERSLVHARRLGLVRQELRSLGLLTAARMFGPTSAPELLAWIEELEASGLRESWLRRDRAKALAMVGRVDEARAILGELRIELAERGKRLEYQMVLESAFEVELVAGDHAAAAAIASEHSRLLEEQGDRSVLSTVAGKLAQALYGLDRLDEAEAEARRSEELGGSEDVITQMLWRQVRAKVLARRGEHPEAERLAREAVELCEETDVLLWQGDAWADLAVVLALAGRDDEAAAASGQAADRYERKGNIVSAGRVRARLGA